MITKYYTEGKLQVSESLDIDNSIVTVSVPNTIAGSVDVTLYSCEPLLSDKPFLLGEDYPVLAQVWDNKEDDVYDTL